MKNDLFRTPNNTLIPNANMRNFFRAHHGKQKFLLCLLFSLVLFVTACSSTKLAKSFDQNTVLDTSKTVVNDLNAKDYDSITEMTADSVKSQLTSDVLSSAVDKTFKNAGEFKKFKDASVIGQKDSKTKSDYAICILQAKYESQTITFTITYDTDMKIAGLYMK